MTSEGTPLHGDRGAWNVMDFDTEHSKDINDSTLRRHLPLPGAAGGYARSDGTDWQRVGSIALADLADYSAGFIIVGGGADWEAAAFDWDTLSAGAGADMVHSHATNAEGGTIAVAAISDIATTYLKLDASNDPVTGLLTLTNQLFVNLGSDTQALILEANAGQTANILEINTSGGSGGDLMFVDASGDADFSQHMAIGAQAIVQSDRVLFVDEIFTDTSGTRYGFFDRTIADPGANFTSSFYGFSLSARVDSNFTQTAGAIIGGQFVVNVRADRTPTLLSVIGNVVQMDMEDATLVTNARLLQLRMPRIDTGSITNSYGIEITSSVIGAGNIVNQYGIRIRDISGGDTLNYAIYSDGGNSYHAGRFAIGGTVGALAQLHVDQSAAGGSIPVVIVDQGDVSEQHIVCTMGGADVDFPAIIELSVTGTPAFWWDESADAFAFTNGLEVGDVTGGNFIHIKADGTIEFNGSATVFNDIYFPMTTGKVGGANQPTWAAFQGNTFEYTFGINDYIHLPSQEISHSYKEGSDITLHIHIVTNGSDVGDTDVNYEIEYSIGDVDEVMGAAVVVTSGDFTITGGTADRTHLRVAIGTIAGSTLLMVAALKVRFRRIALVGGGDAPSADPFVLMVGAHIEEDTTGSRTATTK